MIFILNIWEVIRDFLETGGGVLYVIFFTTLLLWSLIIERFWYFNKTYPGLKQQLVTEWKERTDRSSWKAHKIREGMISLGSQKLNQSILMVQTLVALCPLMGLLGTVSGMIAVFEVMAVTGTGNARLMASGISMATIPTMAGMVAAISGIYFRLRLENRVKAETEKLEESLTFQ